MSDKTHVRKSAYSIVGMGIICAIFLAMMSMFYLKKLPGKADLDRLESTIRDRFGLYLTAKPMRLWILRPEKEGRRMGVAVVCTLRPEIRRKSTTASVYLNKIADAILVHPEWRGKVDLVKVSHAPPLKLSATRRAAVRQ